MPVNIPLMRRRGFLGLVGSGAAVAMSGCLGGDVVHEISDSVRIERGGYEFWEIDNIDSSGEVGYRVRSGVNPFKTFYFTSPGDFERYQQWIHGEPSEVLPSGHADLSMQAYPDDDGIWIARQPPDGGRISIDIHDNHYFVVDYSDYYQQLPLEDHVDDLQASVSLEVVDSHLF